MLKPLIFAGASSLGTAYSHVKRQSLPETNFNPNKVKKILWGLNDLASHRHSGVITRPSWHSCHVSQFTHLLQAGMAIPSSCRAVGGHIYIHTRIHIYICLHVLFKSTVSRTAPTGSIAPCCFGQGSGCVGSRRKASHAFNRPQGGLPAIRQHLSCCEGRN